MRGAVMLRFIAGLKKMWNGLADLLGIGTVHPTITLENRIDGSAYMLSYMARKNIAIDDKTVQAMVIAQYALAHDQTLTLQQEQDFWRAYLDATRLIAPVTIDSIKTSGNYVRSRSGRIVRGRAGFFYRMMTMSVLAALLVTQVYWLIGHKLVGEINRLESAINVALLRYAFDGRIDLAKFKDINIAMQTKTASGVNVPSYCIGDATALDSDNVIVKRTIIRDILILPKIGQDKPGYDIESKCISAHLVRLWRVYDQLYHWTYAEWFEIFWPTSKRFRDRPGSKDWKAAMLEAASGDPSAKDADAVEADNAFLLATGHLKLEILGTYLLPLLYGLLGACAYVLRSVTTEVKAEIFSRTSDVSYRLRLMLGLVAGLSIGWFLHPAGKDAGLLASLSPLALAFVAGYSVELLFAALDRIVSAFSSKGEAGAAEPASK